MAEEELEEVDLGFGSQELVLLLKEFKDVFAWDYSEMPGLDPGLIAHTLNVDPQAKPVAQPGKIFHTEIEGQIVKEVQKLLAAEFIKPIQHSLMRITKHSRIHCMFQLGLLLKQDPRRSKKHLVG